MEENLKDEVQYTWNKRIINEDRFCMNILIKNSGSWSLQPDSVHVVTYVDESNTVNSAEEQQDSSWGTKKHKQQLTSMPWCNYVQLFPVLFLY